DVGWISRSQGIIGGSMRNGWGNGAALEILEPSGQVNPMNFPSTMGFYPGNAGYQVSGNGWTWTDALYACRPGLFAENDAASMWNDNITGDVQWYSGQSQ